MTPILPKRGWLPVALALLLSGLRAGAEAEPTHPWCPVMPEERTEARFWAEHEGQRVYFCCARCRTRFGQDPDRYLAVLATMEGEPPAALHSAPEPHAHAPEPETDHDAPDPHAHAPHPDVGHDDHDRHDGHDHHHGEVPPVLEWLGRFHPSAAHFPVALLIVAAVAEGLRALTRRPGFGEAARFCVWAGAIGALVAAPLGWFNAGWDLDHDDRVMGIHRWAGTAVLLGSWLVVLAREISERRDSEAWRRGYRVGLAVAAVLVAAVGHYGGMLVHGTEYYRW